MGPNTFPNMMAIFGGQDKGFGYPCMSNISGYPNFDQCQFIWQNFSAVNYLTGIFEDAPKPAIWHWMKVGFVIQVSNVKNLKP